MSTPPGPGDQPGQGNPESQPPTTALPVSQPTSPPAEPYASNPYGPPPSASTSKDEPASSPYTTPPAPAQDTTQPEPYAAPADPYASSAWGTQQQWGQQQQPTSGYGTQPPAEGYGTQPPTPGYGAQQPTPGYGAQQPSSGSPYPAQPTSGAVPPVPTPTSGYPAQPTSGYPAQPTSGYAQPTSGYPAQPTTGYPAPASGYPANQPTSGWGPGPQPPKQRNAALMPLLFVGGGILLVLILVAVSIPVIVLLTRGDDPVDTARKFMDALRVKDITTALQIARPTSKPTSDDVFLVADAMSTSWQLGTMSDAGDPNPDDSRKERIVSVRISSGSASGSGYISLVEDPNPPSGQSHWRIPEPYSRVQLGAPRALSYLSINGKTFSPDLAAKSYNVFPGVYTPASLVSTYVSADDSPLVIASAGNAKTSTASFPLRATMLQAASDVYTAQIRTHIYGCAAQSAPAPAPASCPMKIADPRRFTTGNVSLGNYSGIKWTVGTLPSYGLPRQSADGSFLLEPSSVGSVGVSGRAIAVGSGDPYTFRVTCGLDPDYLITPAAPNSITATPTRGTPAEPSTAATC